MRLASSGIEMNMSVAVVSWTGDSAEELRGVLVEYLWVSVGSKDEDENPAWLVSRFVGGDASMRVPYSTWEWLLII